eukprot:401502-Amphidinium_carterae.1
MVGVRPIVATPHIPAPKEPAPHLFLARLWDGCFSTDRATFQLPTCLLYFVDWKRVESSCVMMSSTSLAFEAMTKFLPSLSLRCLLPNHSVARLAAAHMVRCTSACVPITFHCTSSTKLEAWMPSPICSIRSIKGAMTIFIMKVASEQPGISVAPIASTVAAACPS